MKPAVAIAGESPGTQGTSVPLTKKISIEDEIKNSPAATMSTSGSETIKPATDVERELLNKVVHRLQVIDKDPDQSKASGQPTPPPSEEVPHIDVGTFGQEIEDLSDEEGAVGGHDQGGHDEEIHEEVKDREQVFDNTLLEKLLQYEFSALVNYTESDLTDLIISLSPYMGHKEITDSDVDFLNYLRQHGNHLILYTFMLQIVSFRINCEPVNNEVRKFNAGYLKYESENIRRVLKWNTNHWQDYIKPFVLYDDKEVKFETVPSFFIMGQEISEADTVSIKMRYTRDDPIDVQKEIMICRNIINSVPEMAKLMFPVTESRTPSRPNTPIMPDVEVQPPTPPLAGRSASPHPFVVYKGTSLVPRIERDTMQAALHTFEQIDLNKQEKENDAKLIKVLQTSSSDKQATDYYYSMAVEMPQDNSDDEEWTKKYGDNCVYAQGTVDTNMRPVGIDQQSTILGIMSAIVNASYGNYTILNTNDMKSRRTGNRVSLPDEKPPYREAYVSDTTPALVLKTDALEPFKIQSTGRVDLKTVIVLPSYVGLGNATLDTRKLTVALQSIVSGILRQLVEGLTPLAATDCTRYSMMSLFTRAWAIHNMLITCEEFNIQPRFTNLVNGDITRIMADPPVAQVAAQILPFNIAITRGDTLLTTTEVSAIDLQCMRVISAGTRCVQTPAESEWELIGSKFIWDEPIYWAVLGAEHTQLDIPANVNVTAGQIRAFIFRLADLFDRREDLVNGYLRACVLLTGRTKRVRHKSGKIESFFVNSMLEMYGTILPQSWSDNPLWRLQREQTPIPEGSSFRSESRFLHQQASPYYGHMSTLIGLFISLGFSSVLHTMNLTGNNLTSMAKNTAGAVSTNLIQGLIDAPTNSLISRFSRAACGWYPQVSQISVNPYALITPRWSAFGTMAAAAMPAVSWLRMFPNKIPYLVQPMSILYVGMKLDSNWGLSMPGVKAEFKNELQQFDDQRHLMWCASNGESNYLESAKTETPYLYVPYGGFALNTIMQESRDNIRNQKFLTIKRINASGHTPLANLPAPWDRYHPQVIPNMFTLYVGTLLTYSWEDEAVMAPALICDEQPRVIQDILECDNLITFRKSGLRFGDVKTFTTLNTNIDDVLACARPRSVTTSGTGPSGSSLGVKDLAKETKEIEKQMKQEAEKQQSLAKSAALATAKAAEATVGADIPGADQVTPKA